MYPGPMSNSVVPQHKESPIDHLCIALFDMGVARMLCSGYTLLINVSVYMPCTVLYIMLYIYVYCYTLYVNQ